MHSTCEKFHIVQNTGSGNDLQNRSASGLSKGAGVLIPLGANFLLKLIFPLLRNNTKLTTLSTLYNYGKN